MTLPRVEQLVVELGFEPKPSGLQSPCLGRPPSLILSVPGILTQCLAAKGKAGMKSPLS